MGACCTSIESAGFARDFVISNTANRYRSCQKQGVTTPAGVVGASSYDWPSQGDETFRWASFPPPIASRATVH